MEVAYWAMSSWWAALWDSCRTEQSWLSERSSWWINFSFSRLITKYDNVFLQFTTARLITIYDNVLACDSLHWLLQFSTTFITIYDSYYNLRRLVLQFTTGVTIHDIIIIYDRSQRTLLISCTFTHLVRRISLPSSCAIFSPLWGNKGAKGKERGCVYCGLLPLILLS